MAWLRPRGAEPEAPMMGSGGGGCGEGEDCTQGVCVRVRVWWCVVRVREGIAGECAAATRAATKARDERGAEEEEGKSRDEGRRGGEEGDRINLKTAPPQW